MDTHPQNGNRSYDQNCTDGATEAGVDPKAKLKENRGRGMLTPTDREYLAGQSDDLGAQQERNRRYKIRKRVVNGIRDAVFLSQQVRSDRKQVFEKFRRGDNRDRLVEFGVYIYRGLKDSGAEKSELLAEVVEEAERREGNEVSVEITSTVGGDKDKEVTMNIDMDETLAHDPAEI